MSERVIVIRLEDLNIDGSLISESVVMKLSLINGFDSLRFNTSALADAFKNIVASFEIPTEKAMKVMEALVAELERDKYKRVIEPSLIGIELKNEQNFEVRSWLDFSGGMMQVVELKRKSWNRGRHWDRKE